MLASGLADTAAAILDCIFSRRRVLPQTSSGPSHEARALHLPRLVSFVERGAPIELVLPAFPAKAPNRAKVLGRLPDAAEALGLESLEGLARDIASAYPPGARVLICSDGHVFADVVGVPDHDVTSYRRALAEMISARRLLHLRLFSLEDAYGALPPADGRRALLGAHGLCIEEIRARATRYPADRAQLDGIHRFLFEDEVVRSPELTRSQARKVTRARAYEVVRRSDAWSRLVAATFPDALRLSIHPQPDISPKIGIALVSSDDAWLTPWHSVAVLVNGAPRLMRRKDAEALGATVVSERGRPSHMQVPS